MAIKQMKGKIMKILVLIITQILTITALAGDAERIGSVDTAFQLLGPNHKILVEVFDDPDIKGVSCYLSRAKTGGMLSVFSDDPNEASVSCRQIGKIELKGKIDNQKEVFNQSTSLLFKKMRIVRLHDQKRKVLIYLVYSDKLIDGSPKNSISVVPYETTN